MCILSVRLTVFFSVFCVLELIERSSVHSLLPLPVSASVCVHCTVALIDLVASRHLTN